MHKQCPACAVLNLSCCVVMESAVLYRCFNGLLAFSFFFFFLNHEHLESIAVTFWMLRYSRLRTSHIILWETAGDLHKLKVQTWTTD